LERAAILAALFHQNRFALRAAFAFAGTRLRTDAGEVAPRSSIIAAYSCSYKCDGAPSSIHSFAGQSTLECEHLRG
jgi:hypothetical protein